MLPLEKLANIKVGNFVRIGTSRIFRVERVYPQRHPWLDRGRADETRWVTPISLVGVSGPDERKKTGIVSIAESENPNFMITEVLRPSISNRIKIGFYQIADLLRWLTRKSNQ